MFIPEFKERVSLIFLSLQVRFVIVNTLPFKKNVNPKSYNCGRY
jgi:hypothetical protein